MGLVGAALAAVLLAGCAGGSTGSTGSTGQGDKPTSGATDSSSTGTGSATADAGQGGTFSVASSDPTHLTPGNTWSFYLESLLFTGPLRIDSATGEPVPGVATSVTSSDQKVWTIKLAKGWTFSNGEPVTAQSFADAWNATALSTNGWVQNSNFALFEGYDAMNPAKGKPTATTLSGVKVVDDLTLQVTLTKPYGLFPYVIASYAFAPMPKEAFTDPKGFDAAPIGNGPYKIEGKYTANQAVTVVRNDAYPGPKGKADKIVFKPYTSYDTAYNDLLAGNTDIVYPVPADRLSDAQARLGDRTAVAKIPNLNYLAFPLWDKRFDNVKVREAFSMAIDRDALTKSILKGAGESATSISPSSAVGSNPGSCTACAFDPAKAKQLLAEAGGWSGPLKLYATQDPANTQILQAIANQLRTNLGITNITFDTPPYAQLDPQVKDKTLDGPFLYYWGAYFPHVANFLGPLMSKSGIANDTGYDNAKVNDLLDQADSMDVKQGLPLYQQAEAQVWKDMPIAPIYFGRYTAAWTDHVSDVPVGVNGLGDLSQVVVTN